MKKDECVRLSDIMPPHLFPNLERSNTQLGRYLAIASANQSFKLAEIYTKGVAFKLNWKWMLK